MLKNCCFCKAELISTKNFCNLLCCEAWSAKYANNRNVKQKTNEQNKFYHSVVIKFISTQLKIDKKIVHETLKKRFLKGVPSAQIFDKKSFQVTGYSTKNLSCLEMATYLDHITTYIADKYKLFIPS